MGKLGDYSMKVVILAGGLGTRLSEETDVKPKPMVEIGEYPILWHIMKIYSYYGFNDFLICLGYKGYMIKEYFANYFLHKSDLEIDFQHNAVNYLNSTTEPWKITLVDTGVNTMTGFSTNELMLFSALIVRDPNLPAGCTAVTVTNFSFCLWNRRREFMFTFDNPSP